MTNIIPRIAVPILAGLLALMVGSFHQAYGDTGSGRAHKKIVMKVLSVPAGHSRLVDLPGEIRRVSVGNDKIADVVVIAPRQIYVNGRSVGSTNITVWSKNNGTMGVFQVRVARDLSLLKERLHQLMPSEPIEVRELEGIVVLSGRVSSIEAKKKAEAVAKAFAPKQYASVVEVGGLQQVMLEVRFAEVRRSLTDRLAVNLGFMDNLGNFMFSPLNNLIKLSETQIGVDTFSSKVDFAKTMNFLGGYTAGGNRYMGFLDALKENGLAKMLAEPNLIATSGQEAKFLAGGEYPIPVPSRDNVGIQFKEFGVRLTFKPEVLSNGKIKLDVQPEVSELDFTTALAIEGFQVPGLTTRSAKTQLELEDGQGFVIAGLLRDDLSQVVSKVPFLGDIPILGALFRSTEYQTQKTDLMIVVTPRIIRPGEGGPKGPLPGEYVTEPNEWGLFLLGQMAKVNTRDIKPPQRGKDSTKLPETLREMEGRFGHEWVD